MPTEQPTMPTAHPKRYVRLSAVVAIPNAADDADAVRMARELYQDGDRLDAEVFPTDECTEGAATYGESAPGL